MQDLLPYETLASLRQTPTSIVICFLILDSDLSQQKKENQNQTNPNIPFSLTASSTQASISCSRHRRLPAPVHERWMKVSLTTNSRMLGTISFRGITPVERPSCSLFMNLGERQKISPERPRLFQGKEGDRMRDGVPAEWNGHPWGQLCKT